MTSAAGIVPLPRSPPPTPSVITTLTSTCTQFRPSRYHPPTSGGGGAREPSTEGVGGAREGQAPPIDPFEAKRRCPCNLEPKRKVSERQGNIYQPQNTASLHDFRPRQIGPVAKRAGRWQSLAHQKKKLDSCSLGGLTAMQKELGAGRAWRMIKTN